MKHYKKFYEVGNNKYYTLNVDDDLYIATESVLNIGKKKWFRKQNSIVMGFKLLKFSTPIAILFNELEKSNISKKQNKKYDGFDDMIMYDPINNVTLKKNIKEAYTGVLNGEIENLENYIKTLKDEKEIKMHKKLLKSLKDMDVFQGIDLTKPSGNTIIHEMLSLHVAENLEHLYTEQVNAFCKNVFLYDEDCFGTITIYRITTIKNIIKTIDTFIFDKKLVSVFLKTMYEEGR